MLLRGRRRPVPLVAGVVVLCILTISIYELYSVQDLQSYLRSLTKSTSSSSDSNQDGSLQSMDGVSTGSAIPDAWIPEELTDITPTHNILLSASTADRKYFAIDFQPQKAINPNIIPHPTLPETWIVVAQLHQDPNPEPFKFAEIACDATFLNGTLRCINAPTQLPISSTSGPHCIDDLAHVSLNQGPHDARVFYGPSAPYTIYGSNSAHTCFGQWMQDFRPLMNWNGNWNWNWEPTPLPVDPAFQAPLDLQRPQPYRPMEKNWFPFWDSQGHIFIHHDISPQRVFSILNPDGSAGPDLAPFARPSDDLCMAKYMPKLGSEQESIHQATNSLLVTLCDRADWACQPDKTNTYVMTIFQHKTFRSYHSVYEPYLMLFRQDAPFDIRAISTRPLWINGRGRPGEKRPDYLDLKESDPWNQTEMFYVTSMNWKAPGLMYHGYQDDVVVIGFGIEDMMSGGIDVVAGDLLQGLGFCNQ